MSDFGKFFLPGPTEVRPEVLRVMARPVIGHRGPAMVELMGSILPRLSRLFRTERPVYVSTSSATGLMESAIRNCVSSVGGARGRGGANGAGDGLGRVLCAVCGAFSERFHRIARACGVEADRLDAEWGASNEPDAVGAAVAGGDYDAVTLVHSETSTGVLNPVEEIAAVVRERAPDTLVVVDCVSSLAGAPVETDAWGLDFALAGGQKAMALPPGLAFGVASRRALDRSREVPGRGLYFSFEAFERAAESRQTANTPAVSLLYALDAQLARIEAEGLEARWSRHRAMAEMTWAWVDGLRERRGPDLRVLAPAGRRSPTVTCLVLPDGLEAPDVVRRMAERGYTIGGGYGRMKGSAIRIGHMGDHTATELQALLDELESVLLEMTGGSGG